ncbi:hypothetical protein GCM10029978_105510 [Actinoallomurus acanthiterrae]
MPTNVGRIIRRLDRHGYNLVRGTDMVGKGGHHLISVADGSPRPMLDDRGSTVPGDRDRAAWVVVVVVTVVVTSAWRPRLRMVLKEVAPVSRSAYPALFA